MVFNSFKGRHSQLEPEIHSHYHLRKTPRIDRHEIVKFSLEVQNSFNGAVFFITAARKEGSRK